MTEIFDDKLIEMAEALIARRMQNTDETREQASAHIADYLKGLL